MNTVTMPNPVARVKDGPAESPLEVLERTRRLFGLRGTWAQGSLTEPAKMWDSRRCLRAGLEACDGKHVDIAKKHTIAAIQELKGKHFINIERFNDASATKKQDVIAVLDRAIELAKGEEAVSTMKILDPRAGDRKINWDKNNPDEIEDAVASFDAFRALSDLLPDILRVPIGDLDPPETKAERDRRIAAYSAAGRSTRWIAGKVGVTQPRVVQILNRQRQAQKEAA